MTTSPQPQSGDGVPRRRFLRFLVGFSAVSMLAMIAAPIVGFLLPPRTTGAGGGGKTLVGTIADIPLGQGKVVPVGSTPAIIINTEQGVKGFNAICTHLGCIVAWDQGAGNIVCPCHDGRFNATSGAVVSGPPPSGLAPVEVSVEGEEIYVVSA